MFADVYRVSEKLTLASEADVLAAQQQLGCAFPDGYAEYVTTLGEGELCNLLYVFSPSQILKDRAAMQKMLIDSAHFWNSDAQTLQNMIVFAYTTNGDYLVFDPEAADRVCILPRHSSEIKQIDGGLMSAAREALGESNSDFQYFESSRDRARMQACAITPDFSSTLEDWLFSLDDPQYILDHEQQRQNRPSSTPLRRTLAMLDSQMQDTTHLQRSHTFFFRRFGGYVYHRRDAGGRNTMRISYDAQTQDPTPALIQAYLRSHDFRFEGERHS
ncbi:hypothetical protein CCAX7_11320 [Capsulimonas corticalis]|uniref:Knr4/Smi1-like domain-containing protein n=1 Tax=Capsulimonas corticalis TaxID=2219043 RepID=A0A402CUU7_9BACT|nr:SMI1/KNR4 family protein [Capsulimonas corticalis]BDI29081.1 hypothetical protein CCAX7_11320 [Capsulimonas corticalis]